MNILFNRSNIYRIFIIISLLIFCFCLVLIFLEFNKLKKINSNITFFNFLNNSKNEILNLSFKNKRLKKLNNVSNLKIYDDKFNDRGYILFSGYDYKVGTGHESADTVDDNGSVTQLTLKAAF